MSTAHVSAALVIPSDALLQHWQGHRRLTRRLIDAFPEDQLFTFSVGGMRPFGAMAMELIGMAAPMVRGIATENWDRVPDSGQRLSKDDVLRLWDESTEMIDRLWAQIRPERFQETATAFGQSMTTYIALFRGINVGGGHTLPMTALKRMLEENGCLDVRTYIQSGNAIFRTATADVAGLTTRLTAAVSKAHGFAPRVLVLTRAEHLPPPPATRLTAASGE